MMWRRKPKLPPETTSELELFSLDALRELWRTPRVPTLSLRKKSISRADLEAWIKWREWRETMRFWSVAVMTFIAMVASVVAAVEGWLALIELAWVILKHAEPMADAVSAWESADLSTAPKPAQ